MSEVFQRQSEIMAQAFQGLGRLVGLFTRVQAAVSDGAGVAGPAP